MLGPTQYEIETFTGRYVDTNNPSRDVIHLLDIAHALAATCRFGGHCDPFLSVAEHAVFVSRHIFELTQNIELALAGLHHDDPEAYLGDIPRPMKSLLQPYYGLMSDRMDVAICDALNLPFGPDVFHSKPIKDADNFALLVEARHLLPSKGINWAGSAVNWGLEQEELLQNQGDPKYWLGGIEPRLAERLFLNQHDLLMGSR